RSTHFSRRRPNEWWFASLRSGTLIEKSFRNSKTESNAVRRDRRTNYSPQAKADMDDKVKSRERRAIPAVSTILDSLGQFDLPRPLIVDLVRRELAQVRRRRQVPEPAAIVDLVRAAADELRASRVQPVINGT